jgi:hypothetical protein
MTAVRQPIRAAANAASHPACPDPTTRTSKSVIGRIVPICRWDVPIERWEFPIDAWDIPIEHWDVPIERWEFPIDAWDIPIERGEFPVDARDIPADAREFPVDARDIPADAREFRAGSIVGRYRQALQGVFALTPFVPPSRGEGEGERAAGRTAVRPYTPRPRFDYGVHFFKL